jgi:hypothetical protein
MAPNASDRAVAQKLLFKIENVVTIGTACAGDAEHVLVTNQRHVICDESSRGVLMTELIAAYEAFAEGCEPDLPELPIQYADFAPETSQRSTFIAFLEPLRSRLLRTLLYS